ncbi:MAG: hypothetical protein ACI4HM_05675, partial [Ruminococcus sp.]
MTKTCKLYLQKTLSLLLTVLMVVSLIPISRVDADAVSTDIMFGDVNGDGTIDYINDVVMVNNYILDRISFSEEQ